MKKTFLIVSLCFLIISCGSSGDESDLSFSNLGSDEYPQMFYMEYVPCQEGVYYSAENFRNDVLPEWQDLLVEVNSPLVSAYGIQHVQRLSEDEEDQDMDEMYDDLNKLMKKIKSMSSKNKSKVKTILKSIANGL